MVTATATFEPARTRPGELTPTHVAVAIIAAFTVLRLISATLVGLGVDEAYTLAIARQLQLSYFDHPPLHLWIVHLFSGALGYGRLARLPFIALFAGTSWLLFVLTARLFGPRAGIWALVTLNVSAFFTVAAGSWVLPDGPLLFCLLGTAVQAERLMFTRAFAYDRAEWGRWLAIGAWLGMAALAKYQAVTLAIGLGLFLVTTPRGRAWLGRPQPYVAALLTLVILAPVIVWNAQHDWASFAFQGGRAAGAHGLRPLAPLAALAGQAVLLLPWIFVPLAWATWRALRSGPAEPRGWLCVTLGLPGVILFTLTPLWGQSALPHWAMPSWLMLIPLLADRLGEDDREHRWPRAWMIFALAACAALWITLAGEAATGWIGRAWPATFVKGDPTLESVEWMPPGGLAQAEAGLTRPFVVAMKWNEAGRARALFSDRTPVMVFSDDPRGFGDLRGDGPLVGRDALIFVKPEDLATGLGRVSRCFEAVTPMKDASIGRGGYTELSVHVFDGHRLKPACSDLGRRSDTARRQWLALKAQDAP